MGALHAQSFFDGEHADEAASARWWTALRPRRLGLGQVRPPSIGHGWTPENGHIPNDWKGYNEAMLVYLLALGSPTRPVKPEAYDAWLSTYDAHSWGDSYGQTLLRFRRCSATSSPTAGWTSAASATPTCAARASTISRTRRATYAQQAYAGQPAGLAGLQRRGLGHQRQRWPRRHHAGLRTTGGQTEKRRFISYAGRGMGLTMARWRPMRLAAPSPSREIVVPR
jgi:hypothetical protein